RSVLTTSTATRSEAGEQADPAPDRPERGVAPAASLGEAARRAASAGHPAWLVADDGRRGLGPNRGRPAWCVSGDGDTVRPACIWLAGRGRGPPWSNCRAAWKRRSIAS